MEIIFETQRVILEQFTARPLYLRAAYKQLTLNNHITGILGGRGVGKTTWLLKVAVDNGALDGQALYISMDQAYFLNETLLDLVDRLYKETRVRVLCIDEIHKHPNWQQQLKNIADIYHDFRIVFTSSSYLDLIRSQYDLSRRVTLLTLSGFSFREYLEYRFSLSLPTLHFEYLLEKPSSIKVSQEVPEILRLFHEYLSIGYYPLCTQLEEPFEIYQALQFAVQKTIYEDIASVYSLKTPTLVRLEKLYQYVLTTTPGELNANKLAQALETDFNSVQQYLVMLEEAGLIRALRTEQVGKAQIKKPKKLFAENSNLIYANSLGIRPEQVIGTVRETFIFNQLKHAGIDCHYSKVGDIKTEQGVLEVGGKNKTASQIKGVQEAWIAADGILIGMGKRIPLYAFGFLY